MPGAKHWVFTINNWDDATVDRLRQLGADASRTKYLVFGYETAPTTGTQHLQGFITFAKRTTMANAKANISERSYLAIARGSPAQASKYCKKDDNNYEEFGQITGGQGSRTDLQNASIMARDGKSLREIFYEYPDTVVKYHSGLRTGISLSRTREKDRVPEIKVLWGETGTGKSRRVREWVSEDELYNHTGTSWFDHYNGELAVLFDDFDGSWFKLHYLLKLLDRYKMWAPIKGAFVLWNPRHIYITSNLHPEDWYPNGNPSHRRSLMRRIEQYGCIIHCTRENYPW